MARPVPKLSGAQYQTVREKVDGRCLAAVRELEDRYYGTAIAWDAEGSATKRVADGWRDGGVVPFRGAAPAVGDGLRVRKALFDRIHGLLWVRHQRLLFAQNLADGSPYGDLHTKTKRSRLKPTLDEPDVERIRITQIDQRTELARRETADAIVGMDSLDTIIALTPAP